MPNAQRMFYAMMAEWSKNNRLCSNGNSATLHTSCKCGAKEYRTLNPSHPIINECVGCGNRYNPDNAR